MIRILVTCHWFRSSFQLADKMLVGEAIKDSENLELEKVRRQEYTGFHCERVCIVYCCQSCKAAGSRTCLYSFMCHTFARCFSNSCPILFKRCPGLVLELSKSLFKLITCNNLSLGRLANSASHVSHHSLSVGLLSPHYPWSMQPL